MKKMTVLFLSFVFSPVVGSHFSQSVGMGDSTQGVVWIGGMDFRARPSVFWCFLSATLTKNQSHMKARPSPATVNARPCLAMELRCVWLAKWSSNMTKQSYGII